MQALVSAQYLMVVLNGKVRPPLVAFPVTVTEPWAGMANEPVVGSEQPNGGQLLGPTSTVSRRVCSWLPALSFAERRQQPPQGNLGSEHHASFSERRHCTPRACVPPG
jgi:hypothetical protein